MKLYAQLRDDLRIKGLGAPIEGDRFIFDGSLRRATWVDDKGRRTKDANNFMIWYNGDWQHAESIDFNHISK